MVAIWKGVHGSSEEQEQAISYIKYQVDRQINAGANFLDLNPLATEKGFKSIGAVKLCIMLLGFRISKRQRLSDWSADVLTESQIEYAAIDAWICPQILQVFKDRLLYP